MAITTQDSRIIIKRSTTAAQVPTVAPSNDHTDGSWTALNIYKGELFINLVDSLAWFRSDAGIQRLALYSDITANNGLSEVLATGVYKGGLLSVGAPTTTFSISDGNGAVVFNTTGTNTYTPVSWTGLTNITATHIASGLVSYVAINSAGAVIQQLAPFTQAQSRSLIIIGSLIHVNLTNLDAVNNAQNVVLSPANLVVDLSVALGKFNVSGNIFSANGANLNLNKSLGVVYAIGSNWANSVNDPNRVSLAALTALAFQYRFQNGTNGATGIAVNPDIYDLAGVSTAVPNNKFTIQRIYSFVSNNVKIQPGQFVYNSLAEAKAAIQTEVFVTEASIEQNGLLRGFLIIKKGATSLTSATDVFFYEAGKFGSQTGVGGQSVSTMQNAYNNSTDPEILTDATRGAVSVKRGSAADTDNIIEGLNGAGTTTFALDGNGKITSTQLTAATKGSFGITIDGQGGVITTGIKGYVIIPYGFTITSWTLVSDIAGSMVIDLWKDTYANYPPTVADTITAAAKPTLTAVNKNTNSTLTGWTTTGLTGDVVFFNVDSCTTITKAYLTINATKTS